MEGATLGLLVAAPIALTWVAWRVDFDFPESLGVLFTGWRGEPLPRGIQEEDRDRPWGRPAEDGADPAPPRTVLERVQPKVQRVAQRSS
jgi:hypothetical protein